VHKLSEDLYSVILGSKLSHNNTHVLGEGEVIYIGGWEVPGDMSGGN
jgi:hypothetical protein